MLEIQICKYIRHSINLFEGFNLPRQHNGQINVRMFIAGPASCIRAIEHNLFKPLPVKLGYLPFELSNTTALLSSETHVLR